MQRRAVIGMVLAATCGLGLGCQTVKRQNNPYMSDMGKAEAFEDTPREVQEFVKNSYPDAQVEKVYEMRHREQYHMRHFEIHLVLEGGRKKTVDYNTFEKPSFNAQQLDTHEVVGAGTSPAAQQRGEMEGQPK